MSKIETATAIINLANLTAPQIIKLIALLRGADGAADDETLARLGAEYVARISRAEAASKPE